MGEREIARVKNKKQIISTPFRGALVLFEAGSGSYFLGMQVTGFTGFYLMYQIAFNKRNRYLLNV